MYLSTDQFATSFPVTSSPSITEMTIHEQGSGTCNEDFLLKDGNLYGVFDGATSLENSPSRSGLSGGFQAASIAALASIDPARLTLTGTLEHKPEGSVSLVISGVEIHLPLSGLVDQEAERARMEKELVEVESQIARLEGLLGSSFAQKAPAAVVGKERQKLVTYHETANKLREQIG